MIMIMISILKLILSSSLLLKINYHDIFLKNGFKKKQKAYHSLNKEQQKNSTQNYSLEICVTSKTFSLKFFCRRSGRQIDRLILAAFGPASPGRRPTLLAETVRTHDLS
ncbi:hypothetical protein BpHYR1_046892 [Brachionus plicatilis]|uniref:Uncharacterized protein n=1 Tax=Brachionus plicatilis TaxID=10195 RepID=A0A3M7PVC8_BRAPC|nr:hypothetical protein BpHYR1_046892 [Brachionus plicatilis]